MEEDKMCKNCWEQNLCCSHQNCREMITERQVLEIDLKYHLEQVEKLKKKLQKIK